MAAIAVEEKAKIVPLFVYGNLSYRSQFYVLIAVVQGFLKNFAN